MSIKYDSPCCNVIDRKARVFDEVDYVSYYEKESVAEGFDPARPDEFTINKEVVEFERIPISEEINSHASKVGLKNLLKGIVSQKQMDEFISKSASTGGYFDATKLPDSHLEMEKLAGSLEDIWSKIPVELKGDLSKEEFIKTITSEKLRDYVLSQVAKQEEKKEGE